jgi:hypothetical protein
MALLGMRNLFCLLNNQVNPKQAGVIDRWLSRVEMRTGIAGCKLRLNQTGFQI